VTRYCSYPAEVAAKPKIGGYFDPNYEAILALRPDLVVMLEEHEQGLPGFQKLHLETRVVCHKNIRGIIDSIRSIGRICGRGPEARRMAKDIEDRLQACEIRGSGLPHPRVLFSVDRTPMPGHLVDVYIAGHDGYFDEMIRLAGGENAFREEGVRYPVVSAEGILAMNPEVIIDLVVGPFQQQRSDEALAADWNELAEIDAVKQHRVHVLRADYACVPGPRFVQVVEDIARILHPEADQAEQTGTQDLP
jgi:iron complex transport system substrate-binding protein